MSWLSSISRTTIFCNKKKRFVISDQPQKLGSNEAIKQAVAGGLGLAIISKHALNPNLASEGLQILAVDNFPILSNWWIIYPQGKRLSPIAKVFFEHLQDWA